MFSGHATATLQGRRRARRDDADRALHPARSTRRRPGTTAPSRPAAASRRCCRSSRRCSRSSRRARCTLVYGNRTAASVMFLEELADLKDRYPDRFRLLHVLSREPQEAELLSGRLDPPTAAPAARRRCCRSDTVDEWFLCGPFAMVERCPRGAARGRRRRRRTCTPSCSTSRARRRASVGDGRAGPGGRDAARWSSTLDGRATTVQVPRTGERVLDAVLAVRADAPYACKGGVCGTCRAKLVSGEVSMDRNYALDAEEMAAGLRAGLPVGPGVRRGRARLRRLRLVGARRR